MENDDRRKFQNVKFTGVGNILPVGAGEPLEDLAPAGEVPGALALALDGLAAQVVVAGDDEVVDQPPLADDLVQLGLGHGVVLHGDDP